MSLHFLHVCLSESWGGLEMAVQRWNRILEQNGHRNSNVCTPESPLAQALMQDSRALHLWDSAPYFAPDFTWKLRKLVLESKVDVVVLQNLRELWLVAPALWGLKSAKLIGFTQMLVNVKKTDPLHRLIYKRLDRLLTLTDWQQTALSPYLPVQKNKFKTIPNFVDCERFHPDLRSDEYRYQLGYQKDDFLIGVVGRIDKQKGQLELLEAFAKIKDQAPKARLLVVGEPTTGEPEQEAYFETIKDFVTTNNLSSRVRFFSFQKEPQKIFANLDLFVLPSYQETFGFVVVEAMASGTPVLATASGGVPEILGQGEYGFLCAPKSAEALAKELATILSQPQLRATKAQAGLSRARHFYAQDRVYERFIQLLQ